MNKLIEILIVVVILFLVGAVCGCKKERGLQITNCVFRETDPNASIIIDVDDFVITDCTFTVDPNDPNMVIKIGE